VKPHPDELFHLLEELGMKSALAESRRRYGAETSAPLGAVAMPPPAPSKPPSVERVPKATQGELF
jgi:hypothetical protein